MGLFFFFWLFYCFLVFLYLSTSLHVWPQFLPYPRQSACITRIPFPLLFFDYPMVKIAPLLLLLGLGFCFGKSTSNFSRIDFPKGFVFGAGTSAYQVEGAAAEDGRTPSIWDTCAHAGMLHGDTGDIACDQYHKYKEDVKLMKDTRLDAYRFSISWPRLIPDGRGPINPKGLQYYNNLINELISHGIEPHVTLYHYDLPQALEDDYQGWLSENIVNDFKAYADVCFREFGDRVKYWTTLNEPNVHALGSYDLGSLPPQRCSYPYGDHCTRGNSIVEPYIVGHILLLAHAAAATLYKEKYQALQHGFIGLNLFVYCLIPSTNSMVDINATQRAHDFYTGWFANPLVFGDYPETMKKNAGWKLPTFTKKQSHQVRGSFDFFGLNQYATMDVQDKQSSLEVDKRDFLADMFAKLTRRTDGTLSGESFGMQETLEYFKQVYGNPPIYIHENGYAMRHNESLNDIRRVRYIRGNLQSVLNAIRNGSDARGYFIWSFLDLFELLDGYEMSYGLYYVDFKDKNLKRYPKLSAHWYSNFLKGFFNGGIFSNVVNICYKPYKPFLWHIQRRTAPLNLLKNNNNQRISMQ